MKDTCNISGYSINSTRVQKHVQHNPRGFTQQECPECAVRGMQRAIQRENQDNRRQVVGATQVRKNKGCQQHYFAPSGSCCQHPAPATTLMDRRKTVF